ncbi:uncharacterized protein RBU33_022999 isoform 1-T1 [Hipposideros larvatus]
MNNVGQRRCPNKSHSPYQASTIRLMLSFEDKELCKARAWAQGTPCLMEDRHLNRLLWKVAVTGAHSHVSLQREEHLPLSGDSDVLPSDHWTLPKNVISLSPRVSLHKANGNRIILANLRSSFTAGRYDMPLLLSYNPSAFCPIHSKHRKRTFWSTPTVQGTQRFREGTEPAIPDNSSRSLELHVSLIVGIVGTSHLTHGQDMETTKVSFDR